MWHLTDSTGWLAGCRWMDVMALFIFNNLDHTCSRNPIWDMWNRVFPLWGVRNSVGPQPAAPLFFNQRPQPDVSRVKLLQHHFRESRTWEVNGDGYLLSLFQRLSFFQNQVKHKSSSGCWSLSTSDLKHLVKSASPQECLWWNDESTRGQQKGVTLQQEPVLFSTRQHKYWICHL